MEDINNQTSVDHTYQHNIGSRVRLQSDNLTSLICPRPSYLADSLVCFKTLRTIHNGLEIFPEVEKDREDEFMR